ncbi:hypothetical protein GCM10020216_037140 [Nonomuraea helvata]
MADPGGHVDHLAWVVHRRMKRAVLMRAMIVVVARFTVSLLPACLLLDGPPVVPGLPSYRGDNHARFMEGTEETDIHADPLDVRSCPVREMRSYADSGLSRADMPAIYRPLLA